MRIYTLNGKKTTLIWVRDKSNNWRTELDQGVAPKILHGYTIKMPGAKKQKITVYDPGKNKWMSVKNSNGVITLPDFKRSVVIRLQEN